MASNNISVEEFIKNHNGNSLKIIDSTNFSLNSVRKILQETLKENTNNLDIFDFAKINNTNDLINVCNTYPYILKYRYVLIYGIKESDTKIIEEINDYLLDPMKTTKHIFILDNKKINIKCDFENQEDVSENDMINFIEVELKKRNIQLKKENIFELAKKSVDKLSVLSYLQKLESLKKTNDINEIIYNNYM